MAGPRKRIRLGDLLVEKGVLTNDQLMQSLNDQKATGRKLGQTLIQNGFVTEDTILDILSTQLNLPFINLKNFNFDKETVDVLPETLARRYRAIVLKKETDGAYLVAMADPSDIFAYDEITKQLKTGIHQAVAKEAEIVDAINKLYRQTEAISHLAEELGEELAESDFDLERLEQGVDVTNAPVVKLLQTIFEDAIQVGASDIHIEPDDTVLRIRMRIDGVLQEQVMKEKRIATALVSRLKLMASLNISERRIPQDGRFNIKVRKKSIDVRLSTMPIQNGESVVMRLLDQSGDMLNLDVIGMNVDLLKRFRHNISRPHGLVLVTGPTGSGKTTTLYAALNELNDPGRKIITVEDPVEYRLQRINQVQVNPQIGLTFAKVLRTALRQDPDIVLVGEMRDSETAEIALRAAMTGHLVLSTLHTNDAISTANRLLDMGAEGYLVASALQAIIAQRLVRKVCEHCNQDYHPELHEQAWLRSQASHDAQTATFKEGRGCTQCNNTGYQGRIGVFEFLELDEDLADALRREDTSDFTKAAKNSSKYHPFSQHAMELALQGITTLDEVLRISNVIEDVDDNYSLDNNTELGIEPEKTSGQAPNPTPEHP